MQELCLLCGSHKTCMTPCHPESDGLVERFNRTLLMMLAMFAGENRDDWDDLLPAVMMAYRSSVHESMGFSPYRLMFGEECALPMDVGLPRREPDLPDPISSPYAVWVRDALEVAFDQVRRHSGQAVQRQKRLYDQRAVRRLFAVGYWVMRYYPPAKKCKFDSVWVGPYLVVSLVGWALGIQKHPDSPILFVHCQDMKKVPQPSGVMSWIKALRPEGAPTIPVLGASTVARTSQGSTSVDGLPPDEGVVLADVDSVGCTRSLSGSRTACPNMSDVDGSGMDVSSSSLTSAVVPFSSTVIRVDVSCVLHPFSVHTLDAGPIQLVTIAHAFNNRMAVLRDSVKSAIRVGHSRKAEGWFLTDTDLSWGQQVAVMFQIILTLTLEVPSFLKAMAGLRGVSTNVQLYSEPWGHVDHSDAYCVCLSSDRTAAYVHELALMPREPFPSSEVGDASVHTGVTNSRWCRTHCLGVGWQGSVPFVSDRPGAYGCLLLAVYVWWQTGLLVSSD